MSLNGSLPMPWRGFCNLAAEAGAIEKLEKLKEVGAGELLLAVEKLRLGT